MVAPDVASDRIAAAVRAAAIACQERNAAEEVYRAAVLEAVRTGASYSDLAVALRVTRQAVRQLVLRASG